MNKKYISFALGTIIGTTMIIPVFAENGNNSNMHQRGEKSEQHGEGRGNMMGKEKNFNSNRAMEKPVIAGKITIINGTLLTVSGHQGMMGSTTPDTTFTIDTTTAKVFKNNATSTVTSLVVGDTISAYGTLTGTNVVATTIREGALMANRGTGRGDMMGRHNQYASTTTNYQTQKIGTFTKLGNFFSRMFGL